MKFFACPDCKSVIGCGVSVPNKECSGCDTDAKEKCSQKEDAPGVVTDEKWRCPACEQERYVFGC